MERNRKKSQPQQWEHRVPFAAKELCAALAALLYLHCLSASRTHKHDAQTLLARLRGYFFVCWPSDLFFGAANVVNVKHASRPATAEAAAHPGPTCVIHNRKLVTNGKIHRAPSSDDVDDDNDVRRDENAPNGKME